MSLGKGRFVTPLRGTPSVHRAVGGGNAADAAGYARLLDEVLETGDFFQRNCGVTAKSRYPEHFAEAAEAEAQATEIREYAPLLIPGLLQTPAYARAVCRAYQPTAPEEPWPRRAAR